MIRGQHDAVTRIERLAKQFNPGTFDALKAVSLSQLSRNDLLQHPWPYPSMVGRYELVGFVDDDRMHDQVS